MVSFKLFTDNFWPKVSVGTNLDFLFRKSICGVPVLLTMVQAGAGKVHELKQSLQ
jgi:hypothetical protein